MRNMTSCAKAILWVGGVLLSAAVHAAPDDRAMGFYVEAGTTPQSGRSTDSLQVGLTMPLAANRLMWGGDMSFYWDFFLSGWRAPKPKPNSNEKDNYAQIGAIANVRYRFSEGRSPWFVEAGLGGTLMDHLYRTEDREFSTAFQFTEQIGAGLSFGMQREHEVSVRLQHFSNGTIKEPNPGENFVRVRYLYRF